ncbi:TonB-dependent receptor [Alteromonas sp. C1M14]|uniref:TonB-dependent receptor domain-containing protein n=1 Tax=Alteromonas sp. C1M14 TaxID=2841567 RepID=UPI001C0911E8|nr:TonB-dependent receptor [Alteromonas sp. C1M14]MBU2978549.1 TonB-dependent receptor [Alteromonas sp. C1M14]
MKEYRPFKLRVLSALISGVLIGQPVLAQSNEAPSETSDLEKIVITGSNIRGASVVGGEVKTIDTTAIENSGRSTLADYLREIPSNLGGGVGMSDSVQSGQDTGVSNANLSGGQGVNLRGLGALSTLVLVNGRRLANSGQYGDFVDLTTLPMSAISRVEILQDGASAIYGSDAVGGVVNFVTSRYIDAPVTKIKVGTATEGGGDETSFSHIHGFNWDSGNAVVGAEYYKRSAVRMTDRDRYSQGTDFTRFGGVDWTKHSISFDPVARIFANGTAGVNATVGAIVPEGANDNLTNADLNLVGDDYQSTYNVYEGRDILPDVERHSIYASFDQDLTDEVQLYGDIRYTDRTNTYDMGYAVLTEYPLTSASPYYIEDIDPSLTGGAGIYFGKVYEDVVQQAEASVSHVSGQLGLKFDLFNDWYGEAIVSYASDSQERYQTSMRMTTGTDLIACALGNMAVPGCDDSVIPLNPFSTEPLSDAQIAQYYGYEKLEYDSSVLQATFKADGTLMRLPAGDLMMAAGIDFRQETIDGYLRSNTMYIATTEGAFEETQRDAYSGYLEALVPVTEDFDVSVAGRYEKFSGSGNYDTFDPKVSFDYRLTEAFTLKGSWGTSFHAPPMRYEDDSPQPTSGGNSSYTLNVSRYGPCDNDIITYNGIVGTPGVAGEQCSFSLLINSGGAGKGILEPEQAETWTLGFTYTPDFAPGLSITASYFDIQVDDRIQRIQSGTFNEILTDLFDSGTSPYIDALILNPSEEEVQAQLDKEKYIGTFGLAGIADSAADVVMIVNATQMNIASLRERGIDYNISYDFDLGAAEAGVYFTGTYLTEYALQGAPGTGYEDQLGKYTATGTPVKLRARQGFWAEWENYDLNLTVNYTDSYECDICYVDTGDTVAVSDSPIKVDSWTTVDLALGLDLSPYGDGVLSGMHVSLQVANLFNEDAPFIDASTGVDDPVPEAYDSANATIIGRTVGLQLTKTW